MARRSLQTFRLRRETWAAIMGLENPPGRLADDCKEKLVEQRRIGLIRCLLRRMEFGDCCRIPRQKLIEALHPSDFPRERVDLAGHPIGCRTPLDIFEIWGLEWLIGRLHLDEVDEDRRGNRHAAAQAIEAAERLVKLKSAAIGGCFARFGADVMGRPLKVTWAILDKAWADLETKLARLRPVIILPVITIEAPRAHKSKKHAKPRLVHSREPMQTPPPAAPAPVVLVAADTSEGGTTGDGAA